MAQPRVLRIFPDSERVDEALWREASHKPLVSARDVLPFWKWVDLLVDGSGAKVRRMGALEGRLLVRSLTEADPGPFGNDAHTPFFAGAVLELISELKSGELSADQLVQLSDALLAHRTGHVCYLAELYRSYQAGTAQRGWVDREDLLVLAKNALAQGDFSRAFEGYNAIELRGFSDFSPLLRSFLLALARSCHPLVKLVIHLPVSAHAASRAAVDALSLAMEKGAQELSVELRYLEGTEQRPLATLAESLFGEREERVETPPGALELSSVASSVEELRILARFAREQVNLGVAADQVALVLPRAAEQAERAQEALEEVGLRSTAPNSVPLRATPTGRAALQLLDCVEEEFPAALLARLLAAARWVDEEEVAGQIFAQASIRDDRMGRVGDCGAYDLRLGGLAQRMEQKGQGGLAKKVMALKDQCLSLMGSLRAIPPRGSMADLLASYRAALGKLELLELQSTGGSPPTQPNAMELWALRREAQNQRAQEQLGAMLDALESGLEETGAGRAVLTRRAFQKWLLWAAEAFPVRKPKGARGGAVKVLDIGELAERSFQVVCVGGMVEGSFPRAEASAGLLSDGEKLELNRKAQREVFHLWAGGGTRATRRLAQDRLAFCTALVSAREKVRVVFPREQEGQETLPSPFIEELSRRSGLPIQNLATQVLPSLAEAHAPFHARAWLVKELLSPTQPGRRRSDPLALALTEQVREEPWFQEATAVAHMEEERLRFFGDPERAPGPYTGFIDGPSLAHLTAQLSFGAETPVAASELERFGRCAFQGFLSCALHLIDEELPAEEQDAKGRGSFWHLVLEKLFSELEKNQLLHRPPEEVPDALLQRVVALAAEQSALRDHVGHPFLWRLAQERALAMAKRLLSASHRGLPFGKPMAREVKFGRPSAQERWQTVILPADEGEQPIHLQGRIDRLDEAPGGAAVVDYKSSLQNRRFEDLVVTDFQLPIYLYALRQAGYPKASEAAWMSMRDGKVKSLADLLSKHQTLDELLGTSLEIRRACRESETKNLANAVHELVRSVRAGNFPIRPVDCGPCGFRATCRITERKSKEVEG